MSKHYIAVIYLLLLLSLHTNLYSQDLTSKDLSKVRVDQLTDTEISKYQQQIKAKGLSEDQAAQLALDSGLPPVELSKLRQRLAGMTIKSGQEANNSDNKAVDGSVSNATAQASPLDPKIFGAELFGSASSSFQPNLKIATPVNYTLGPDDQLQVSVYGLQEAGFSLTITPEGNISIPNVGQINVSGLTVEAATARIRSRMSTIYTSLRTGASKLSITLGNIRSIRITILGSVKPGTYTVSSLSTLFNALYISGGPSINGSFREIELLRDGKVDRVIDLYNFLLAGSQVDNVRLRENDVIRIPIYKKRVEITGEVRRPGIFELIRDEKASDLINFASGFTDSAYRATVKVYQVTPIERQIKDLVFDDFIKYVPQSGDVFEVSKILNVFRNRVSIQGAVLRGGNFELTPGLTVGELINKAFLREDAYTERGQIVRMKADRSQEVIPFDVRSAINGISTIPLQKEDIVSIFSIGDLRDVFDVRIQGEVRKPGTFRYVDSLSLKDLILNAGGFSDAAYPQKIEIARVIRRDTLTAQDTRLSQIIEVRSFDDLSLRSKNILLMPSDVVTVRRLPGYLPLESVIASGQLQFPGPYVLSNREERISDLLRRAGGFTPEAFAEGAFLKRINQRDISTEVAEETADKIQKGLKDSTGQLVGAIRRPFDQIPLNLNKIMNNPGIDEDLVLKPNDELFIPRNDEEIRISGEVLFPTLGIYNKAKGLKDYVNDAGGFTDNARKKKSYVLYPNGRAASTTHFLFFRNYPEVRPGSEIVVPTYVEKIKNRRSSTEIIGFTSALASLAYIVIALIRL